MWKDSYGSSVYYKNTLRVCGFLLNYDPLKNDANNVIRKITVPKLQTPSSPPRNLIYSRFSPLKLRANRLQTKMNYLHENSCPVWLVRSRLPA